MRAVREGAVFTAAVEKERGEKLRPAQWALRSKCDHDNFCKRADGKVAAVNDQGVVCTG